MVGIGTEARIRANRFDIPRWHTSFIMFKDPAIFRISSEFLFWDNPVQESRFSSSVALMNFVANTYLLT